VAAAQGVVSADVFRSWWLDRRGARVPNAREKVWDQNGRIGQAGVKGRREKKKTTGKHMSAMETPKWDQKGYVKG